VTCLCFDDAAVLATIERATSVVNVIGLPTMLQKMPFMM
jgi:hypothetical protein